MNNNTQSAENYIPSWETSPSWGSLPGYFASFAFPTNSLPPGERIYRRDGNRFITVEPGDDIRSKSIVPLQVPSGLFPRLALPLVFKIYKQNIAAGLDQDEARVIDLAKSRNELLTKLGLSNSGKSYQMLNDQFERLARCRIALQIDHGYDQANTRHTEFLDISLTQTYKLFAPEHPERWNLRIVLGETLAKDILTNSIPINCELMIQLARSSMRAETSCWVMDVASWLLYRLYRLGYDETSPYEYQGRKKQRISVSSLRAQFPGHRRDDRYLEHFEKTLKTIKGYWPSLVMPTIDRKGKAIWIVESPLPLSYQQLVKNRRQNDHQDTDS